MNFVQLREKRFIEDGQGGSKRGRKETYRWHDSAFLFGKLPSEFREYFCKFVNAKETSFLFVKFLARRTNVLLRRLDRRNYHESSPPISQRFVELTFIASHQHIQSALGQIYSRCPQSNKAHRF